MRKIDQDSHRPGSILRATVTIFTRGKSVLVSTSETALGMETPMVILAGGLFLV